MNDKKIGNESKIKSWLSARKAWSLTVDRTPEGIIKGGFIDFSTNLPLIGGLFTPLKTMYLEEKNSKLAQEEKGNDADLDIS